MREVARVCRRTTETVRRWIWEGKLPAEKLGNQLFGRRADLMRMASRLRGGVTTSRMTALEKARVTRERIGRRIGGTPDVLRDLDRSREAHP